MTNEKETITKEKTILKPYTKEVKIYVYDIRDEIVICPNTLSEILKQRDDIILPYEWDKRGLPYDWELTQEIFDSLMEDVFGRIQGGDVFEGDWFECEEFLENLKEDEYDEDLNYTNQNFVFDRMLKWTFLTKIDFSGKEYWTISEKYGGRGTKFLLSYLEDDIRKKIDPYNIQLDEIYSLRKECGVN